MLTLRLQSSERQISDWIVGPTGHFICHVNLQSEISNLQFLDC